MIYFSTLTGAVQADGGDNYAFKTIAPYVALPEKILMYFRRLARVAVGC